MLPLDAEILRAAGVMLDARESGLVKLEVAWALLTGVLAFVSQTMLT